MLRLQRLDPTGDDRAPLVAFFTQNTFPFHVYPTSTADRVEKSIDSGAFRDDEHDSYWLMDDEHARVGLVRLEDLADPTPMFDLRLDEAHRGSGLGVPALEAITAHVFTAWPEVTRFEGQTREDNLAMRKTFLRCGWLKEAHYRESWPVEGGEPVASVAYAILRRDWQTGTVTRFEWEDLAP